MDVRDGKGGIRSVTYRPRGGASRTCPVAAITPESYELVELFLDALAVRKCAGASGLGRMVQQDARLFDAAAVIQRCRAATKAAFDEAIWRQRD